MESFNENVTSFLSFITLVSDIVIVLFLFLFICSRFLDSAKNIVRSIIDGVIGSWSLYLAFFVALSATLGSLFYSSIVGFEPCLLCWYQRIVLFPQVIILAIALYIKDKKIYVYGLALSVIGILVSAYHYYGQMFSISSLPCSSPSEAVSPCAQRVIFEYGYITMPLMAGTAFAILIILFLIHREHNRTVVNA